MATQVGPADIVAADSLVLFQDSQGLELSATLLHLSRFQVGFAVSSPSPGVRTSEVLQDFRIILHGRSVFAGRATVTALVNTGAGLVCEAKLEDSWKDLDLLLPALEGGELRTGFRDFLQRWQKIYKISPAFKAILADMHTFLADLRLWLDQVELGIRSAPSGDRVRLEHDLALELGEETTPALAELFQKFEAITEEVERGQADQRAAHSALAKRLLHPLLLTSPFLYRSFRKPLGYAGDYEMVNMIWRDPVEGSTFFAKIVNLWFLQQPPAEAHRNRVRWLADRIAEVAAAAAQQGRPARIASIGCGPAVEVQQFLKERDFSSQTQFTLIDFNQETVEHARNALEEIRRKYQRQTQVQVVKKSVNQILKEAARSSQGAQGKFDFVYCAGLFDYLSDQTCRLVSNVLYEWVLPGGLFVSTNVDATNPRRLTMEYIMDWHLIYRSGRDFAALRPERAPAEAESVVSDNTSVNLLYSVRKPKLG